MLALRWTDEFRGSMKTYWMDPDRIPRNVVRRVGFVDAQRNRKDAPISRRPDSPQQMTPVGVTHSEADDKPVLRQVMSTDADNPR
jgi:hypothetical protein